MKKLGPGVFCVFLLMSGPVFAVCLPQTLDIRGPSGQQRFSVEIADDAAGRQKGLMFRESMPMSAGMLFVFESPKHSAFWMKNTLIPLDMIFVDSTGTVTQVHSNAIPLDETSIDGGDDVAFVLEINGGLAKRMGIAAGAQIRHPMVQQNSAKWPCTVD